MNQNWSMFWFSKGDLTRAKRLPGRFRSASHGRRRLVIRPYVALTRTQLALKPKTQCRLVSCGALSHLLCGISRCYTFVKLLLSPGVIQTKLLIGWLSNSNTRYKSISWLWQYSMYSSWEVWNGCQHGLAELRSQCPFLWTGPLSNCTLISCLRLEPTSSRSAAPYTFFVRHQFLGIKGRKVALQAAVVGSFITKWVWLRSIVVHSHIYMYI